VKVPAGGAVGCVHPSKQFDCEGRLQVWILRRCGADDGLHEAKGMIGEKEAICGNADSLL